MPKTPTAADALSGIRKIEDNHARGIAFEKLFEQAAPLIPDLEVRKIWRWANWPDLRKHGKTKQDLGVDLVAKLNDGTLVAIQCKLYAPGYQVSKSDVQSFIAGAHPKIFQQRWIVSTSEYGSKAEELLEDHQIHTIDFQKHLDLKLTESRPPCRKLLPLQKEALQATLHGFEQADRGRLIMACGTGKTFTSLRIAEKMKARKILFIAPSIALIAQARKEWLTHTCRPLECTVVCSDQTTAKEDISALEISCRTTTDPGEIAERLAKEPRNGNAQVVFCTYQSLNKMQEAQKIAGKHRFGLAVVDEAHRTTGYLDEDRAGLFQLIHDPEKIRARKRLYMTATPRIYDLGKSRREDHSNIVDMNDEHAYGREFYRLSFKKAVEAGMLCDYHVIALGIEEGAIKPAVQAALQQISQTIKGRGKSADTQAFLALAAIRLALQGSTQGQNAPGVLARTIAYASNIRRSKWLEKALQEQQHLAWIENQTHSGPQIHAEHLDGNSSYTTRNRALRELENGSEESPRLVSNAQLFTEGVDVPALNAIAFLDPRNSKVDTIQAVGRVMRKAPGKTSGYIIVPVILPPGADAIEVLENDKSRFKALGAVLRALQSHDERLATELTDRLTFETVNLDPDPDARAVETEYEPKQGEFELSENAKQAIYAQIAKNTGIAQRGRILADAISQSIEKAARTFENESAVEAIAAITGTPADNAKETCKTGALLIANGCIMHRRLDETGNLGALPRIERLNQDKHRQALLSTAWEAILKRDYQPIFQDAQRVLQALPESCDPAIGTLIQCAIDNAASLNDLGFDHAGPLYHRILGSAKSDGAFYTKNLSAYLLAGLTFHEEFCDWADPEAVKALRVIDPACGTGTLLKAALNTIKQRAVAAQNLGPKEEEALHKHLVENCIYGLDINPQAIQLAACNLTIGAPNTDYACMNLRTMPHGPDSQGIGRHGSLELLRAGKTLHDLAKQRSLLPHQTIESKDAMKTKQADLDFPDTYDAIIYNPPFTDTNKQAQKYTQQDTETMRKALLQIKETLVDADPDAATSIARGSIQPYFTPMANMILNAKKGAIAKIIPATMCTSENARSQRQYIAKNTQVEMVITSHDPKHPNLSASTSIHECIIIARRGITDEPTRFIQLAKYPESVEEADKLIQCINEGGVGTSSPKPSGPQSA